MRTLHYANTIEADLARQGFRLTKLRKAMIRIFTREHRPLSFSDVQKMLKKYDLTPHKVTLYREFDFLKAQQVIAVVDFNDGLQRFEYVHLPHHHHAVCLKCKKIEDIAFENDNAQLEQFIEPPHNFQIMHHALAFFGLCSECK